MPAPSQKAREFTESTEISCLEVKSQEPEFMEALDSFTLELREALSNALLWIDECANPKPWVGDWRDVLTSYTPTPEEEKG